jgi:hypothetical protein
MLPMVLAVLPHRRAWWTTNNRTLRRQKSTALIRQGSLVGVGGRTNGRFVWNGFSLWEKLGKTCGYEVFFVFFVWQKFGN